MQTTTSTRTYAIDPAHSEAGFTVRHLMISKVRGHFAKLSGTVTLGPAGDIPTQLDAVLETGSVTTRDEKRDGHLRSADFFDAETHPQITFTSTAIAPKGNAFTVTGDLTIRGTTKSVTLEGEVGGHTTDPWGNDRVGYSATTRLNRQDFGVSFNKALDTGGVMVSDEVDIALEIEAILQK
jgi:polyisoprenoid-binding protein YceI